MELDGHPTEDIIEELRKRGAVLLPGTDAGPDPDSMKMILRAASHSGSGAGLWVYLPKTAYETEIDEVPADPTNQ